MAGYMLEDVPDGFVVIYRGVTLSKQGNFLIMADRVFQQIVALPPGYALFKRLEVGGSLSLEADPHSEAMLPCILIDALTPVKPDGPFLLGDYIHD